MFNLDLAVLVLMELLGTCIVVTGNKVMCNINYITVLINLWICNDKDFVFVAVCVCGEFSDGCGGHVPRDLQERLQKRAADSWHVYNLFLHRSHHVYGGKDKFNTVSMNMLMGETNK